MSNTGDGGAKENARVTQKPIQRWLVLTEYGVEFQPCGNRGLVDQFARSIRPYRRRLSVVTETRYNELHDNSTLVL